MPAYAVPAPDVQTPHCTELIVRRSRFLAQAAHVSSLNEGRAFVELLRNRHVGASHNCWACVAGAPGSTAQNGFSDDGEPHGTAGRPMLQILQHSGVGEICVVVTRWFGGVKLGTGGLVRAYQDAVRLNLEQLPLTEQMEMTEMAFVLDYAHVDGLLRLLPTLKARLLQEDYGVRASFCVTLPQENGEPFRTALTSLSNGSVSWAKPASD